MTTAKSPPDTAPGLGDEPAVFSPGPVLRRSWLLVGGIAVGVATALLLGLRLIPAAFSATSEIRVLGTESESVLSGRIPGTSPEEELEILIGEFSSPQTLAQAQGRTGTGDLSAEVTANQAPQGVVITLRVTTDSQEAAIALANEIPKVVAEERAASTQAETEEVVALLRAQASEALAEASQIDAILPNSDGGEETFELTTQRDALVATYNQFTRRAAELIANASVAPLGFVVDAGAEQGARLPHGVGPETVGLALLAGLMVGAGVVLARDIRRPEILPDPLPVGGSSFLGEVGLKGLELNATDLHTITTRLRSHPSLSEPHPVLLEVRSVGSDPKVVWTTTKALGKGLGGTGLEVISLLVEPKESSIAEHDRETRAIDLADMNNQRFKNPHLVDLLRTTLDQSHAQSDQSGSLNGVRNLGTTYSGAVAPGVEILLADCDVVLVNPVDTGIEFEGKRPDLMILVATDGLTSIEDFKAARLKASLARIETKTVLLGKSSRRNVSAQ